MKKTLSTLFGALLALTLLAAACGGDDSSSAADQEVIDAVADQIRAEGEFPPDTVDADCMAAGMVNGLGGADGMKELGLDAEAIRQGADVDNLELSQDRAVAVADSVIDCGVLDMMAAEMSSGGTMSEDDAQCLVEKMDQDALRDGFASELMGDGGAALSDAAEERLFSSMFSAVGDCDIDPSSLGF